MEAKNQNESLESELENANVASAQRIQELEEQLKNRDVELEQIPILEQRLKDRDALGSTAGAASTQRIQELEQELRNRDAELEQIPILEQKLKDRDTQISRLEGVQKQVALLEEAFEGAQHALGRIPQLEQHVAQLEAALKENQEQDVHAECIVNIQDLRQKLKSSMDRSAELELIVNQLNTDLVLEKKKSAELDATSELVGILEDEYNKAEATIAFKVQQDEAKDVYIEQLKQEVERYKGGYSQMMERDGAHTDFESQLQAEVAKYKGGYEQMLERDAAQREYAEKLKAALTKSQGERKSLVERDNGIDFVALESEITTLRSSVSDGMLQLEMARHDNLQLRNRLQAMQLKIPLYLRKGRDMVPAPTGSITLCFTDVEGSTVQWEANAEAMAQCIGVHNDLMRIKLEEYHGYEVKTEGDAFMVAFSDPNNALNWCLDVQQSLLNAEWPEESFVHPKSSIVEDEDEAFVVSWFACTYGNSHR